jgi:hypothetical protein
LREHAREIVDADVPRAVPHERIIAFDGQPARIADDRLRLPGQQLPDALIDIARALQRERLQYRVKRRGHGVGGHLELGGGVARRRQAIVCERSLGDGQRRVGIVEQRGDAVEPCPAYLLRLRSLRCPRRRVRTNLCFTRHRFAQRGKPVVHAFTLHTFLSTHAEPFRFA